MKLRDKVAVVTGGGRGIGKAIALTFAEQGASLVLAARTAAEVEAVAAELRSLGRRAIALSIDVSRRDDVERMVAGALTEFGRIDILVNNAALQSPIGPLWENDPEAWLQTVQVNLGGVFLCCWAVLPVMIRQGSGKIINLSGGGATSPRPCFTAYGVSKTAVVRLTETLAEEVEGYNIQVNAIAPGAVYTRMTEEVLAAGAAGERDLAEAKRVKEQQASPQAAAELAVFLASDESDGLTGRLISAVWDDWRNLDKKGIVKLASNGLYALRRIDDVFFCHKLPLRTR